MVLFKKQNEIIWLDELDVSLVSAEPVDTATKSTALR